MVLDIKHKQLNSCVKSTWTTFYRDCDQAEGWMNSRESLLTADEGTTDVDSMIKRHEDFDKAIAKQEEKIASLNAYGDQLIESDHYAIPDIIRKKEEVQKRWEELKEVLIQRRTSLSQDQTLQLFSRKAILCCREITAQVCSFGDLPSQWRVALLNLPSIR